MGEVVVLVSAGSIGLAIARRIGAGKRILVADLNPENAAAAADVLRDAGFDVATSELDVSSRKSVGNLVKTAVALGEVTRDPCRRGLSYAGGSCDDSDGGSLWNGTRPGGVW
jgi:NAD(P)-dependent dehydrogenase (short-subunit alcohol dehydrogenase family)